MDLQLIALFLLGIIALAGGFGLIATRNPMYSVLFLVLNFFCIAGLYLTLDAEFLFAVQIIVYAGAIMVLFLFVVMLLNLNERNMERLRFDTKRLVAYGAGFSFLGLMLYALAQGTKTMGGWAPTFSYGKVEPIGMALMTEYLFPFELISVILLAALIGAVIIAKKHQYEKRADAAGPTTAVHKFAPTDAPQHNA